MMEDEKKVSIKDLAVTQSNSLVEATYPRTYVKRDGTEGDIDLKVSTRAHKVSRLIVSLISPDDADLRFYRIDISALKSYLGYKVDFPNGKFYQDLKDIANRLNKQPIEIRPEPKRVITAYFISSYEMNYKTGEIIFEISGQLKPFLLHLKNNFTSFHLDNIPKLSSGYSIRLYELLYQYKSIGKRAFDDLSRLQAMIGSSYDQYGHFKARVLEPTKKDISQNTNISFEYEEVKTGKKVTKLIFHINENAPVTQTVENDQLTFSFSPTTEGGYKSDDDNNLSGVLRQMGIKNDKIAEYIKLGFDIVKDKKKRVEAVERCRTIETYYAEKITLLRSAKPDMGNPTGFLIKALQEDWITSKATKEIENQKLLKALHEKQSRIKQLEKRLDIMQKHSTELQKPIFEKLASDELIFMATYKAVLAEFDENSYFHQTLRQSNSPQEAYKNSTALNSIMNNHFFKCYPTEFESIKPSAEEIESVRHELNLLKNSQ